MKDLEEFRFTRGEKNSAAFIKLENYLAWRIDQLRCQNDGDLDERKTGQIRGAITEIKRLMDLGKDNLV